MYEKPFLGGFNKPKVQWFDWNNDGIDELFLLDEDGSIRYFKMNELNNEFNLIDTKFLNISNISWFYIGNFDLDNHFEIITQDSENVNQMILYEIIDEHLVELGTVYTSDSIPVESNGVMTPTFCDIDNDEDFIAKAINTQTVGTHRAPTHGGRAEGSDDGREERATTERGGKRVRRR